jgi:hypothetical protein
MINLNQAQIRQSFAGAPNAFEPFTDADVAALHEKLAAEVLFHENTFADVPGNDR